MLRLTSLFLFSLSSYAAVASLNGDGRSAPALMSVELMAKFSSWSTFHGKAYDSHDEKIQRLQTWVDNDRRIQEHNNQIPTPDYLLGHNEYSAMTQEEFAAFFKLGKYSLISDPSAEVAKMVDLRSPETAALVEDQRRALLDENLELPDYINWVQMGAVTDVKNQGSCGSCWAFSTTGALEGSLFIKTGQLTSLSEQNLLDCDHEDLGCNGGLMDNAFKFDEKSGGICSEEDYPYVAKQNKVCNTNCTDVPGSEVKTFVDVPPGKEKALLGAIAMQPISIAIQADQFSFQFYKTGVITDDSCGSAGNIDHGVLAVGYGTDLDTQQPYFLVKNSWGATWGDAGYVKIGRKTKHQYGICAILKMASFPILE